MESQNQPTASTTILGDLLRSNRDVKPERNMKLEMLNAATESELKTELQNCQAENANLKKQMQEIWGREIRTSAVNNSAQILINSYLETSSLGDETKQPLQHILSVLASDNIGIKEESFNFGVVDANSETPIEYLRNTASEEYLDESVMQISNKRQMIHSDSPSMKRHRRDNNFSNDIANSDLRKQSKVRNSNKFPKNNGVESKAVLKVGQSIQSQTVQPKLGSSALRQTFSALDEPDLGRRNGHELLPIIKIEPSIMEQQCNSSNEIMGNITEGNPLIAEKVNIYPTKTKDVVKPLKPGSSSNSYNDKKESFPQIDLKPNSHVKKTPFKVPILGKSVAAQVSNQSKNQLWPKSRQSQKDGVDLQEQASSSTWLTKQTSISLFTKILNVYSDTQDLSDAIETLCKRLHYHPLALQLAAAYIKADLPVKIDLKKTIENYLIGINQQTKTVDRKCRKEDGEIVPDSVHLTWKMTIDKLKNEPVIGSIITNTMNIVSVLSPKSISLKFIWSIVHGIQDCNDAKIPEKIKENVVDILKTYEVINGTGRLISVHQLVQKATRLELLQRGEYLAIFNKILVSSLEMLNANKIPMHQMGHVETMWEHTANQIELIKKHPTLPISIYNNLNISGKFGEAYKFCCGALNVLEPTLGLDNRWALRLKCWKGNALQNLGNYAESLELLTEVFEKQKKLFGEDHDDCLRTANLIGIVYFRLKNYERAMIWYQRAAEKRERIYGKDNPETRVVKKNIGIVLGELGRFSEATEIYKDLLEVEERLKGPEHHETLRTKFNFACLRYNQEAYEKALRIFSDVLDVQERVLELDHPETLTTKDGIAGTYEGLGRIKEAYKLTKEVYEKRLTVLGTKHPDTIRSKNSLERIQLLYHD